MKHLSRQWRIVKMILYESWDPLGVRGHAKTENEYDSYVGRVLRTALTGEIGQLADLLTKLEIREMQIRGDPAKNHAVAERIIKELKTSSSQ